MGCFVQGVKFVCDVLSTVAEMAWNVLSRVLNLCDVLCSVAEMAWDVLTRVLNLCVMFRLVWQKWHGMFCPGYKICV